MTRISYGLAGAWALVSALVGTAPSAGAQFYYAYGAPPGYDHPAYPPARLYCGAPHTAYNNGDPLHRYYIPGIAPNVENPSVSPFYMAPHVDDGLIYGKGLR